MFLTSADFSKFTLKKIFRNTTKECKSLDPDTAPHFFDANLCPNCLQRLSADDNSKFVVGILFSVCPCMRPSVTFCFLNILKSHCWIFIKPCKHVHICKTNTLDKKGRARDQFY